MEVNFKILLITWWWKVKIDLNTIFNSFVLLVYYYQCESEAELRRHRSAMPMYSRAALAKTNHLDLWGVISQMSSIREGQWQMHLSTSSSAQGYPGVLRSTEQTLCCKLVWSNGIHSKLTWKMTSLSNLEPCYIDSGSSMTLLKESSLIIIASPSSSS